MMQNIRLNNTMLEKNSNKVKHKNIWEFQTYELIDQLRASYERGNRESSVKLENLIKPRVYVMRIMRSTMYEKAQFS